MRDGSHESGTNCWCEVRLWSAVLSSLPLSLCPKPPALHTETGGSHDSSLFGGGMCVNINSLPLSPSTLNSPALLIPMSTGRRLAQATYRGPSAALPPLAHHLPINTPTQLLPIDPHCLCCKGRPMVMGSCLHPFAFSLNGSGGVMVQWRRFVKLPPRPYIDYRDSRASRITPSVPYKAAVSPIQSCRLHRRGPIDCE